MFRDVRKDLTTLKNSYNTTHIVTLMENGELKAVQALSLFDIEKEVGICPIHWPLPDGSAPTDGTLESYKDLVIRLAKELMAGSTIIIHCLGGLGRTGTLAAAIFMVLSPVTAKKAIKIVRKARPGAVESLAQVRFLESFEPIAKQLSERLVSNP